MGRLVRFAETNGDERISRLLTHCGRTLYAISQLRQLSEGNDSVQYFDVVFAREIAVLERELVEVVDLTRTLDDEDFPVVKEGSVGVGRVR